MRQNGKGGNGAFILIIVAMAVMLGISLIGMYNMSVKHNDLKQEVDKMIEGNKAKAEAASKGENTNNSTKCTSVVGKYYGELIDTNLHMKQTYVFSEDGSYITSVENGGIANGSYTLTNGTIYFTQKNELGPSSETNTYFYNVSDDCKVITAYAGEKAYKLNLVTE